MPATRASPAVFSAYSTTCVCPSRGVTVARNGSSPPLRTSITCGAAGSDSVWFAGPREAPSTYRIASAGSPVTRTSPSTAPEVHRDAPLGAALDGDRLRRGRVAGERQQHFLRHAGRHADGERRAAAIAAADADVGARGPALHDQPAIRHAELDRPDRERLARDHGDRAFEAAELRMHQRERVTAGVELGLERRRAELAIVRPYRLRRPAPKSR